MTGVFRYREQYYRLRPPRIYTAFTRGDVRLAEEVDEALSMPPAKVVALSLATETDSALSITAGRIRAIGLTTETDSALSITVFDGQSVALGMATETDSALSVIQRRLSFPTETDEALTIEWVSVGYWPYDDLKPRHIGIHPIAAPIGGGVALTGREPAIDSGCGYWRIVYGGVDVRTRAKILAWRAMEGRFGGRSHPILIYLFDGKRAPWTSTPGGAITATANASVAQGATSIAINATSAGELKIGQHFSYGHHPYRITDISGPVGSVYTCTIWPKSREAIASGAALEFRRPIIRVRLEDDGGMSLPLHLLKRGETSIAFVEDVP